MEFSDDVSHYRGFVTDQTDDLLIAIRSRTIAVLSQFSFAIVLRDEIEEIDIQIFDSIIPDEVLTSFI